MSGSIRRVWERLWSYRRRNEFRAEMQAEMNAHLDMAIDDNVRSGMTPEEARRQAMIRFGGVDQANEKQYAERGVPALDILWQDLRYTFRTLSRDMGFATIAVLILALGIGANVVVFSVVNTMLLRPLPFSDPQRLVWMEQADAKGLSGATYSADTFGEYRQQNRSFEDVAAYNPFYGVNDYKLTGHGEPQPVSGVMVTGNFFQVLGLKPALGRFFTEKESVRGAAPVIVLGNAYWRGQFGGDPAIVGKSITLNEKPITIAGVLPENFDFGSVFDPGMKMDFLFPYVMDDMREDGNDLAPIGRLKQGVTIAEAQMEWRVIGPRLYFNVKHPEYGIGATATLSELKAHVTGKLRRSLIVLWCAVGMILLIVCVNLANLLIARAAARQKEFALRSALGAGRWRLVRQMVTESLVLAGMGAVLGLAFAYAATQWLAHQGSIALPLLGSVRVDGVALAWTVLLMLGAAVLFGVAPALRVAGGNLQDALKDSGRGSGEGRKHERLRSTLVVSEIALACVLLVCAGLLLRSFLRVLDVDLGFQPSRAAALTVDYQLGALQGLQSAAIHERRGAALQNILQRIKALPGVEAAGVSDMLPLDRNRSWGVSPKGRNIPSASSFIYVTTPGYIGAMGIRLREGRDLSWDDHASSQQVVVINETAARRLWPGERAVGKTLMIGGGEGTVIGVVDDIRETGVEETSAMEAYLSVTQADPEGSELVVRTKLPPAVLAASVMRTLREINPGQPSTEFRTIQSLVDRSTSPRRFFAMLVGGFAALGLLLASLGIYGVISYSVTRRTQEIGIRMALGATLQRVRRDVMSGTLRLAVMGVVIGGVASVVAAHAIGSLLFGTKPGDPLIYAGMVVLLVAVALIAGYIPARRASRIDPMVALRNE